MNQDRCCCCFSVKTGVWLIGALEIIGMVQNIYNGLVYDMLASVLASLILSGIFCVMFLFMMVSPNTDSYKLRNSVFLYYLIAMTIIPVAIVIMGMFNLGFDFVGPICREAEKQAAQQDPPQHIDG